MYSESTALRTVAQSILNEECARLGLGQLDADQIAALDDEDQWLPMLADLEARCGLNVTAAAQQLRAAELVKVWDKEEHIADDRPEALHKLVSAGATSDLYNENTGGGVWNSFSVHQCGTDAAWGSVLAVVHLDGIDIYRMGEGGLQARTAEEAEQAIWDDCGEHNDAWMISRA